MSGQAETPLAYFGVLWTVPVQEDITDVGSSTEDLLEKNPRCVTSFHIYKYGHLVTP